MEKKTIGKFIAVLRKASGMTQRELGEKLYVSDKTVSRWERDECTPELSLIPAIAEIFGITTDELLRGERKSSCSEFTDEALETRQKAKSDKQFGNMLYKRITLFKFLSLISIGAAVIGLISAAIWKAVTNIGFTGFFVALIFLVCAVICQLCFLLCSRLRIEEDEAPERKTRLQKANTQITLYTIYVLVFILTVFAFILPLMLEYQGTVTVGDRTLKHISPISLSSWLYQGLVCSGIALCISHISYMFFFRKKLMTNGRLIFGERENRSFILRKKLLIKTCIIFAVSAVLFLLCVLILNIFGAKTFAKGTSFDNYKDLQAFVNEVSKSSEITVGLDDKFDPIFGDDEPAFARRDENGDIVFGYTPNSNIYSIDFTSESKMDKDNPAVVYTAEAMNDAYDIFNFIQSMLYWLIVFDFIICAVVYLMKLRKIK